MNYLREMDTHSREITSFEADSYEEFASEFIKIYALSFVSVIQWERSDSVVECLTQD